MNTLYKKAAFLLLFIVVSITMASIAVKYCSQKKELQKAKKQVHENFQKPYAKSDSTVGTTPKTDIGAAHSEVEQRRFPD